MYRDGRVRQEINSPDPDAVPQSRDRTEETTISASEAALLSLADDAGLHELAGRYTFDCTDQPRVSVVVCTYNGGRTLDQCLRSLAALDYQETINFSFVEAAWEQGLTGNADPIAVQNPIAAQLAVMRSSLIGSLVGVLRHNLARRAPRVRVFEIGRVFRRDGTVAADAVQVAGIDQPLRVAGLAWGPAETVQWGLRERSVDFFDVKGDVEALLAPLQARWIAAPHPALHPGRSARIELAGRTIGWCGELHPRWRQSFELPSSPIVFELDLAAMQQRPLPQPQPVPRVPSATRDLSLRVPASITHDALIAAVLDDGSGLLRSARLFDVYQPPREAHAAAAERRLAVRIELRDDDSTLTDERIEVALAATLARLQSRLGARLRD